jgi:hypothetical protein
MFQSSAARLRSWWSAVTEDILGGDLEADEADVDYFRSHPHRRPLSGQRVRRDGAIPPRPAHCLTPIRPGRATSTSERRCRALN